MMLMRIFVALQLMDVLTTVAALRLGGSEENPLMGSLMHVGTIPGLLLGKLVVIGIGLLVLYWQRYRVLKIANVFYASLIGWNLFIVYSLSQLRA